MRDKSTVDTFIKHFDDALKTLWGEQHESSRPYPAANLNSCELDSIQRKHAAGLMRVNYAGEVAAQALYQGQALTARHKEVREKMQIAAEEEKEHLAWCKKRLDELEATISHLNPAWYFGSLFIGIIAGAAGDKWSLGFLAETEKQVCMHLETHLGELPKDDQRSKAIVQQMKADEAKHEQSARNSGAAELPPLIKGMMNLSSKIMTKTAYYL